MKLTTCVKALAVFLILSLAHEVASISFTDAENALQGLQVWYNSTYGLWIPSTGWWNSANCLTTLANLAAINDNVRLQLTGLWQEVFTKAPKFNVLMTQNFGPDWKHKAYDSHHFEFHTQSQWPIETSKDARFLNAYYDDEGWWALAWIAIYDLTGEQVYLHAAENIFDDMSSAFNTTLLGGIWWDKNKTYVNAIANELHFSVAAHLANRCPENKGPYLGSAVKSWDWIVDSGLINDHHNIIDGLNTSKRRPSMDIVWSYNQGVILGALVELSQATGISTYLDIAVTIANAALANLTASTRPFDPDLILHDICEPRCGRDGDSFKGIFARNLAKLYSVTHIAQYGEFLLQNAEAIWQNDRDWQNNQFGLIWSGPFVHPATAATQCSAMDALVGALDQLGEWNEDRSFEITGTAGQDEAGGQDGNTVSWLRSETDDKIGTSQSGSLM